MEVFRGGAGFQWKMSCSISVITVCRNSESTIGDTLISMDDQVFQGWENWIIDGASTDRTLDVVGRLGHGRRRLISEPDAGIYDAMNKGIAASMGEVVGFLNADDFYETPDALSAIAERFDDPEVDLIYGNLNYVAEDDTDRVVRNWVSGPFSKGLFRSGWVPPHPTVYARREVFDRVGVFDTQFSIGADWEWLYRAFEIVEVRAAYLNQYLVRMRLGGVSNRSFANIVEGNRQAIRAFHKYGQRVPPFFFPGKLLRRGRQFLG